MSQCCLLLAGECIPIFWQCDGEEDCIDKSDEHNCRPCNSSEFTCANNKCVPRSARCDTRDDCRNGEDELHCAPCSKKSDAFSFECSHTHECINASLVCDGVMDCYHGEDEATCEDPEPRPSNNASSSDSTHKEVTLSVTLTLIGLGLVFLGVVTFMRRRKRKRDPSASDGRDTLEQINMLHKNNVHAGKGERSPKRFPSSDDSARDGCVAVGGRCNGSGSALLPKTSGEEEEEETMLRAPAFASIERPRLTGASSVASSSVRAYPEEPLNPPPTTAPSGSSSYSPSCSSFDDATTMSAISSATRLNQRTRRVRVRDRHPWRPPRRKKQASYPHYTSPCSTVGESDCADSGRGEGDGGCQPLNYCINPTTPAAVQSSRRRRQQHQQQLLQYYRQPQSDSTFCSDATFSDDESHRPMSPPRPCSPVTEASFFANPPPSLVNQSPVTSDEDLSGHVIV